MQPASEHDIGDFRFLLTKLGFDEREVEVYLALLSLGMAPASTVAKHANLQRSNTYLVLRSLQEKGLASAMERGKILHFVPEPPEKLIAYSIEQERQMQNTRQMLEGALPLLRSFAAPLGDKPRVTVTMGFEGVKQVFHDALQKEYLAMYKMERINDVFGTTIIDYYFGDSSKKIAGRELVVASERGQAFMKEHRPETVERRLLPAGLEFDGDLCVIGNALILFGYDEDKTVVRIDHATMSSVIRALFEEQWARAGAA